MVRFQISVVACFLCFVHACGNASNPDEGGDAGRGGGYGDAGAAGDDDGTGAVGGAIDGEGGSDGAFAGSSASGAGGDEVGGAAGTGGGPGPASIDELLSRCPDAASLDAIDRDLELVFDNLVMDEALVCSKAEGSRDLNRPRERAYQALLAMKAIEFREPLPWTGSNLYDWFVNTVDGIVFEQSMSYCCSESPDGRRYLHILLGENAAVFATDLWVDNRGLGMLNMVDVMVHEARHAESGNHTCPDGSSDRTFTEMGAWSAVYSLHRWLAYQSDPCFLRPTLPPSATRPGQVFAADAYQSASLRNADRTAEVRFCETAPPLSDVSAEPLPICEE